jgi:hypothetical protein
MAVRHWRSLRALARLQRGYGGYGARRDMALTDLHQPEIFDLLVDIFTDPQKRNPNGLLIAFLG